MTNFKTLSAKSSTVISPEISSVANDFWTTLTDERVVRSVDLLGLLLILLAVYLLCLQTYKSFKEQGLRPKVAEIVLPILMIGLVFNSAVNLKELTFPTKNTVNGAQAPLSKVMEEGSRSRSISAGESPIIPVTYVKQTYKFSEKSGVFVNNSNISTGDVVINAYIKELARKYHNHYSIY